ncbi:MAG: helix-turn-helix domain-containing protein [Oligosphaeraceae bacterium]
MEEQKWQDTQEKSPETPAGWWFSPALRRRLTEKRLGLGLTYASLGRFLGVSWATVRKWELGKSRVCQQRHRRLVQDFLRGDYDQALREDRNRPGMGAYLRPVPREAVACVQRFANGYRLLGECPQGRRLLVEEAQRAVRQVLSQLLKESLG